MYQKILIPTDGSEPSQKAVQHGLTLAKEMNASVSALYVGEVMHIPSPVPGPVPIMMEEQGEVLREAGQKIVDDVVEKGKKIGVTVTPVVVIGHPADQIIKQAEDYDLVVMGTMGKSGLSHLLMGSVAEKVVRHSPVPVLVVPPKIKGKD